ncbi:MAG: ammonia-forming cytochrome c nitrite reductase subunit c552 [Helicobacteraceae bacterium]|jgi:nitrite reductase (cytochrome c-552)|nr:ammonia-forming cytochrome c nitrite reductase subunit c552 [Helicobacteraceae bacterium]
MKKYIALLAVSLAAIVALGFLVSDVNAKEEERQKINAGRQINIENPAQTSQWRRYFPRQFDGWKKTKESDKVADMIKKWPALAIVWAGYPFSKDYNAPRGHYYSVMDNINTLRVGAPSETVDSPLPTACWTCKSPDVVRLMETKGDLEFYSGQWNKWGDEVVNAIGCYDCHTADTRELKMGRAYVNNGLRAAGMPTFEDSTHQNKRDLVCAQCHSEYYFRPTPNGDKTARVVTLPWKNGLGAEEQMSYYNDGKNFPDGKPFKDFENKLSKTPIVKAQHPDYELHLTGIHGKKGVSCADCHMPYKQEGATKYSDHQIQSPLDTMDRSCMPCHRESETKLKSILEEKYQRKETLFGLAVNNLAAAHLEAQKAWESGASEAEMAKALNLIREGQWRWDYASASHGGFFHAPDETLFVFAKANDYALQARAVLREILVKRGVKDYVVPDFSSKAKAQKLAGWDMEALISDKQKFKDETVPVWIERAKAQGLLDENIRDYKDDSASWFGKSE